MRRFAAAFLFLFIVTVMLLGVLVLADGQDQKNTTTPVVLPTPPTQAATQVTVEPTPMIVPTPDFDKGVVLSPSPK